MKLLQPIFVSGSRSVYVGSASELVSRLFTIILLWAGGYFVLQRAITHGELLSFYALIGYFTGPAASLIGANRSIQDALIAADRLFMDLEQAVGGKITLQPDMVGDITFWGILPFGMVHWQRFLSKFSLTISKGKITAVVGESGSGKSTLLSLVQGLYPLQQGSICIGQYDIRHIHPDSLRRVVSVVPQKIDFFAGNVIGNIAVGDLAPNMERVFQLCTELGVELLRTGNIYQRFWQEQTESV